MAQADKMPTQKVRDKYVIPAVVSKWPTYRSIEKYV